MNDSTSTNSSEQIMRVVALRAFTILSVRVEKLVVPGSVTGVNAA